MGAVFTTTGSKLDDKDLTEKNNEYMQYISTHIRNVHESFWKIFAYDKGYQIPGIDESNRAQFLKELAWFVKHHDESKYGDEEFYNYRRKFFPTEAEFKVDEDTAALYKEEFEQSWRHHYTHNDHHPQFWSNVIIDEYTSLGSPKRYRILTNESNKPLDMGIVAICHMICDWNAMSINFGTSLTNWFNTQADKERHYMSEKTLEITTDLVKQIYKDGEIDYIK